MFFSKLRYDFRRRNEQDIYLNRGPLIMNEFKNLKLWGRYNFARKGRKRALLCELYGTLRESDCRVIKDHPDGIFA